MSEYARMPEMAYPFAVFGAAAGWLAAGFLSNPIVNFTHHDSAQHLAAGSSMIVAAGLGLYLTRRVVASSAFADPSATWFRLVVAQALGGALSGAVVGGLAWFNSRGLSSGAAAGVFAGLAFLPIGALVVASARRAARARMGSIVAASDLRAVWGILASALAGATLLAVPDWPASGSGTIDEPWVALGMTIACGALLARLLVIDRAALAHVRRLDREAAGMEVREPADAAREDDPDPEVDFGLGDDVLARMARGAAAYRDRDRATALLLGSSAQALAALRRAVARGTIGLEVVAFVLVAHAFAASSAGLVTYRAYRCATGAREECRHRILPAVRVDRAPR